MDARMRASLDRYLTSEPEDDEQGCFGFPIGSGKSPVCAKCFKSFCTGNCSNECGDCPIHEEHGAGCEGPCVVERGCRSCYMRSECIDNYNEFRDDGQPAVYWNEVEHRMMEMEPEAED